MSILRHIMEALAVLDPRRLRALFARYGIAGKDLEAGLFTLVVYVQLFAVLAVILPIVITEMRGVNRQEEKPAPLVQPLPINAQAMWEEMYWLKVRVDQLEKEVQTLRELQSIK